MQPTKLNYSQRAVNSRREALRHEAAGNTKAAQGWRGRAIQLDKLAKLAKLGTICS